MILARRGVQSGVISPTIKPSGGLSRSSSRQMEVASLTPFGSGVTWISTATRSYFRRDRWFHPTSHDGRRAWGIQRGYAHSPRPGSGRGWHARAVTNMEEVNDD